MQLEKVVIGLDFNEPSLTAARWMVEHFAPDAAFILVHSLQLPRLPGFLVGVLPPPEDREEAARRDAERNFDVFTAALGVKRAQTEIGIRRPADELARVAVERGADLVVVGEHGGPGVAWDALGSTAEQLVRDSPVPVLVARGLPEGAPRRILVGVDESEMTAPVLGWARFLAGRFDARVIAVHVLGPGLFVYRREAPPTERRGDAEDAAERATRRWLAEQVRAAGFAEGEARTEIAFGDPRLETIAAAQRVDAELIVVGSRGADAVGRARLGGIANSVLRGTSRPALVVVAPREA